LSPLPRQTTKPVIKPAIITVPTTYGAALSDRPNTDGRSEKRSERGERLAGEDDFGGLDSELVLALAPDSGVDFDDPGGREERVT